MDDVDLLLGLNHFNNNTNNTISNDNNSNNTNVNSVNNVRNNPQNPQNPTNIPNEPGVKGHQTKRKLPPSFKRSTSNSNHISSSKSNHTPPTQQEQSQSQSSLPSSSQDQIFLYKGEKKYIGTIEETDEILLDKFGILVEKSLNEIKTNQGDKIEKEIEQQKVESDQLKDNLGEDSQTIEQNEKQRAKEVIDLNNQELKQDLLSEKSSEGNEEVVNKTIDEPKEIEDKKEIEEEKEEEEGEEEKEEKIKEKRKEELKEELKEETKEEEEEEEGNSSQEKQGTIQDIKNQELEFIIPNNNSEKKIIGLDIEWFVTFQPGEQQRKTSLIQIYDGKNCLLFHIFRMGCVPLSLQQLLKNPNYIKVGVNIRGDILKLSRDYGVVTNGYLELAEFSKAKLRGYSPSSLNSLLYRYTLKKMEKSQSTRLGNWEDNPLSEEQINYAANDVVASYELFFAIQRYPLPKGIEEVDHFQFVKDFQDTAALTQNPTQENTLINDDKKRKLTPSSYEAFRLFSEEKKSLQEIAEIKKVKLTTVECYLYDAFLVGFKIDFERIGINSFLYDLVIETYEKLDEDQKSVASIKKILPSSITFLQIRFVLADHEQKLKSKDQESIPSTSKSIITADNNFEFLDQENNEFNP